MMFTGGMVAALTYIWVVSYLMKDIVWGAWWSFPLFASIVAGMILIVSIGVVAGAFARQWLEERDGM